MTAIRQQTSISDNKTTKISKQFREIEARTDAAYPLDAALMRQRETRSVIRDSGFGRVYLLEDNMKATQITRSEFDWAKFAGAVTEFAQSLTLGSVEPFVIVELGKLILDDEDLALADGEEVGGIPTDPIERLEAGFALFAPFATFRDFCELACADGDVIEVPDLYEADLEEDEDDEDSPRLTAKQRKLIEATVCDENHSYGYQIALDGAKLVFRSVLVRESDGECDVEAVEDAGLVDKPMTRFLKSFSKRARKAQRS